MFDVKNFTAIKWVVAVVIPAIGAFVGSIGDVFDWEHTAKIVVIICAIETFLGSLIIASNAVYMKTHKVVEITEGDK